MGRDARPVEQQLPSSGQRTRVAIQLSINLARAPIDRLVTARRQPDSSGGGNVAGELASVDPDHRLQLVVRGWKFLLCEDGKPGLDARLNRIDEGSIQVEDERRRRRKVGDALVHRWPTIGLR